MRRLWLILRLTLEWIAAVFVSLLLMTNIATMPVLAGVCVVPIASTVRDPYARTVIKMFAFIGMTWAMLNFAEVAVIIAAYHVREAAYSWAAYFRVAREERRLGPEAVPIGTH
jgi:hypothetical protein